MPENCSLDSRRQDGAPAQVGSPTGRYLPIANESLARKSARCRAIAQQQASRARKPTEYEVGERIGPHTFHSYVGGNPKGLYVNLLCACGNVFPYSRSNLSQLRSEKKNMRYCAACTPRKNHQRKTEEA